jgi:hypothetical protein
MVTLSEARWRRNLALPVLLLAIVACDGHTDNSDAVVAPAAAPPTLPELLNATYAGVEDTPVTLVDGEWRGDPYVEGGASRPSAGLARQFSLFGDVDNDGIDEAVVLIWTSSGGSGTYDFIAVMDRDSAGAVVNTGTAALGDRVKVQTAQVVDGQVILEVIEAGPEDAACCPRQKVRRTFQLQASGLTEIATEDLGRVTDVNEPAAN